MDNTGQWSTLEPAHQQYSGPQRYIDGLQVAHSNLPQADQSHNLPEATTKPETSFIGHPAPPYDSERRICGLKRKVFIILAGLVAFLVVGAIVGGAVGGTVGKSKSTSTVPSSPTTTGPSSAPPTSTAIASSIILSNSSLSSANWTDSKGYSHHAVIYQGRSNSLLMSLWDSQNTTWTVKNISVALGSSSAALSGTPLSNAVTSYPWPFQLNLYYLSPSNQILELYTIDQLGEGWTSGSLSTYNLEASAGSQLASYWQRCDYQCSQQIVLLYEDTSQKLNLANGTNWGNPYQVSSVAINHESSMALVPLAPSSDINRAPYQLRAYVDVSETSQEWMWTGYAGKGLWYSGMKLFSQLHS